MINDVPYISQWDSEAGASKNDCGPVSLTMVLRKYGEKMSADEIFWMTGAGSGYVSFWQLMNVATQLGYSSKFLQSQTDASLKALLDQGLTPIALVQYGFLKNVQDKIFKGPHLLVVTGYDANGYYVNDPNFWGDHRSEGKNHYFTNEDFLSAWKNTTTDGNSPQCLLIIYPKNIPKPMQNLPVELQKYSLSWKEIAVSKGLDINSQQFADYRAIDKILSDKLKSASEEKDKQIQTLVVERDSLKAKLANVDKYSEIGRLTVELFKKAQPL